MPNSIATQTPIPTAKLIQLKVRLNDTYRLVKLYLDIEQFSQKIMWSYFSQGQFYEPAETKLLQRVLTPGDTFIDIGAHIGYYSLIAALLVGENGQVFSVEPNAININWIRHHIAANQLENIEIFPTVLGGENKAVEFFINADNDGGHALWDVGLHKINKKSRLNPQTETLQMSTLDDLLKDKPLNSLKLIKIDAEGAEYQILQGAENTLFRSGVPYVICEINRFALQKMGTSETQLRELMGAMGYTPYLLRNEAPHLVKLSPDRYYNSPYVFNLVFART
ncbi:FkbM family methyltransferase [Phormidium sp. CCY1219]|uniref:FkbM family methyltransferase n=1 Tax=Phormidium sp. CCY1219 TaxID=2886104 RepID=UPI002D1E4ED4|nr:FkbM family methyltransferase [Phormidium sp. CCY1219]MEB3826064.1 FkbM family methyltransferase [Phormidium sp. CCY1219]